MLVLRIYVSTVLLPYVRSLLVLGARAVLNAAATKADSVSCWAVNSLWFDVA